MNIRHSNVSVPMGLGHYTMLGWS